MTLQAYSGQRRRAALSDSQQTTPLTDVYDSRPFGGLRMATIYSVTPVSGGWAVIDDRGSMPLMFLGGAKAEAKALQLALLKRRLGDEAYVKVFTRDGRLAAVRE